MKRIELAYRGQLLSYENASKQLEIQVIKSFLNLVSRKETIAFMEESLDVAEKILERDRVAREHGMLSELQWLNSRLSAERARYNLSDAITTYQNELGPFLTTLGMDVGMDINFTGNVEIVPVNYNPEELILEYLPKRPDIIAQRQTIERLELTKKISTSNNPRLPSLSLDTQWRGGSPNNNSKGFDAPFTDSLSGSLTVNIPIDSWIPGTRQNQSLRSADAEVEKAKLDLQNTETNAKNNIRLLVSNLNNTWESLQIAQLRMEIAQHTVDATEKGFINGIVEFRELENVRKDLTDYRQQLIRQEYAYQSLLLDLAAALNVDWRTLTNEIPSFEALNQRSIR
jgi:multidrug efflux system outer membrane protein